MYDLQGRELATFLQRLLAYLLDSLFSTVPLVVFVVSLGFSLIIIVGGEDVGDSGQNNGLTYTILAVMMVSLVLWVGYFVWWLIVLRQGQTPGKQIAGIHVIRVDGSPSGCGFTFLREVFIKGMLGALLSGITWRNLLGSGPLVAPLGREPPGITRQNDEHCRCAKPERAF